MSSRLPDSRGPTGSRPLLRGAFHALAFILALPAIVLLRDTAKTPLAARCVTIYGVCLLLVLGISTLYHRITFRPAARARMRLCDHSAIFLLIAGTYTPICLLAIGGSLGRLLCSGVWLGAFLGIAQTLFWPGAPRALHVGIYAALGWLGVFGLAAELRQLGPTGTLFHVAGGVLYTLGAVIYARKRPDPWPRVFGYHELYHVLVVIACAALFEVVRRCALVAV